MTRQAFILIWSNQFPRHPAFRDAHAQNRIFQASAEEIQRYLAKLGVAGEDTLLLNAATSCHEVLASVGDFVRGLMDRSSGSRPEDLIVYFVGHGIRTANDSHRLVFSFSEPELESTTTLSTVELLARIREVAWSSGNDLRIIGLFDACYSGLAANEFEKIAAPAVPRQIQSIPRRGLALICSAPPGRHSTSRSRTQCTQFTEALLSGLGELSPTPAGLPQHLISLRELEQRMTRHLVANYHYSKFERPALRSLLSVDGDIADVPLFTAMGERPEPQWSPPVLHPRPVWPWITAAAGIVLALVILWLGRQAVPPPKPAEVGAPITSPPLDYTLYRNVLPPVAELSVRAPPNDELKKINYQVCNHTTVPIIVRFANCSVLARERLPAASTEGLTHNKDFQVVIGPDEWNDLKVKPFTARSGSGWYLVFVMPVADAKRDDAHWQLLKPLERDETAVHLFRYRNTNLIVHGPSPDNFKLRVIQRDEEIEDCAKSAKGTAG